MANVARYKKAISYIYDTVIPYEGDPCLIWPFSRNVNGYGKIVSKRKVHYIHRMMCEMVNGEPPSAFHVAAHECGNGHLGCVNKRHVSWKTHQENMDDKRIHGTALRGADVYNSKFNKKTVAEIRASSLGNVALAKKYGVNRSSIRRIKIREAWSWLT